MKLTTKKLILTGIALLTMASISACGNNTDSETTEVPNSEITTEAATATTEAQKEVKENDTLEESEKEESNEDDTIFEESKNVDDQETADTPSSEIDQPYGLEGES